MKLCILLVSNPATDPFGMILNALVQNPVTGIVVGLLLLGNIVLWLVKSDKRGRRR